jgi:hypothetical protein
MSTRFLLSRSLLTLCIGFPSLAGATTVYQLDTPALVHSSSEIVIGRVEKMRSYVSDDRRHIFTEISVVVDDRFKGDDGARITLVQLGGEVDGMRYTVPGSPLFKAGEEALLFVWRDGHGTPQVNGLAQGKFDITRDPQTGERFVQRTVPGLAVRDARTLALLAKNQPAPRIPLSTMLREIQRAIEEDGR